MKPNLFKYATSELSQDAFISWLISWADKEYKSSDSLLHDIAIEFLNDLFSKDGKTPPELRDIKVTRQSKYIDILVEINLNSVDKYAIIIEDKTTTEDHSKQLIRYFDIVQKEKKYTEEQIIRIYFKTYFESIHKNIGKYRKYGGDIFLNILKQGIDKGIKNDIYMDFYNHLKIIQDSIKHFDKKSNLEDWKAADWIGFYLKLQEVLENKANHWHYVPNANKGFYGFNFHWKDTESYSSFIALEQKKLCFKIKVTDSNRQSAIRNSWSRAIMDMDNTSTMEIKKPNFGKGLHMTIAYSDNYIVFNNGQLDLGKTIKNMQDAEILFDKASEKITHNI